MHLRHRAFLVELLMHRPLAGAALAALCLVAQGMANRGRSARRRRAEAARRRAPNPRRATAAGALGGCGTGAVLKPSASRSSADSGHWRTSRELSMRVAPGQATACHEVSLRLEGR
jgi:hypothetical protein